ncbi:hypothetical protein HUJ04_011466 [Dendroctonus ponderosae]|nr:hypothetical protein HUJ04_011466 [Dendroctonus ponderosae]
MAVENPEELYRLAQEESRSFEQKCAEPAPKIGIRHLQVFLYFLTYPGAHALSDHSRLVGTIKIKLKRINKETPNNRKDISKLRDVSARTLIMNTLKTQMLNIEGELKRIKGRCSRQVEQN